MKRFRAITTTRWTGEPGRGIRLGPQASCCPSGGAATPVEPWASRRTAVPSRPLLRLRVGTAGLAETVPGLSGGDSPVSMDTEAALNEALVAHLRDDQAIGEDEVVVAWATAYVALLPDDDT